MYTKYFGFNEKPFTLTPNPRFIYLSKNHKESFAHLLYGINNHYGFIELIGEVGTGKTTVLRTLLSQLGDENYRSALIFNPGLGGVELLRSINQEFGLNSSSEYTNELLAELNRFLLAENSKGTTVVLVIDEAQNLRPDVLEQLRLISNLETENDKLIQIVLAGQPELEELLARPELRQLNQRIAVRYRLRSMSMDETRSYIRRRMEVAGETGGVSFSLFAIRWIYLYTRGVPRMINILCDRALLVAYGDEKRRISSGIVTRAIREILNVPQRRYLKFVFSAIVAMIVLITILSMFSVRWIPGQTKAGPRELSAHSNTANDSSLHTNTPESSISPQPASPQATTGVAPLEKQLLALEQNSANLQAFNDILSRWNVARVKVLGSRLTIPETAVVLARNRHLRITEIKATLREAINIDIPFLLETRIAGNHGKYYLAVTSVSAETANISPALSERNSVPIRELESLASGTCYLVWNNLYQIPDNISVGDMKYEIRALQKLLKLAGVYNGPIDGVFSQAGLEAVRAFQKKNLIPANDTVGAQTVAYLYGYDKTVRPANLRNN
ncbi:MAG: AAA family ATPase [Deltaproteobacteria bacterium]|nr:AAA family ATPase [Deltaproteobacteria bacterium]